MSTFNVFSVFSYELLIKKIHKLKVKHFNTKRFWNSAIILDTSYLRHPPFMSFRILKDYIGVEYFDRWIKYMKFKHVIAHINNMIEVMAEYEEWKKWAKKEVKRRTAIIWGNNQKYKPLRQVIY
jgi:hypothetical protein